MSKCAHILIDYDASTGEYYCMECGDTVEKPEDWDYDGK